MAMMGTVVLRMQSAWLALDIRLHRG